MGSIGTSEQRSSSLSLRRSAPGAFRMSEGYNAWLYYVGQLFVCSVRCAVRYFVGYIVWVNLRGVVMKPNNEAVNDYHS